MRIPSLFAGLYILEYGGNGSALRRHNNVPLRSSVAALK